MGGVPHPPSRGSGRRRKTPGGWGTPHPLRRVAAAAENPKSGGGGAFSVTLTGKTRGGGGRGWFFQVPPPILKNEFRWKCMEYSGRRDHKSLVKIVFRHSGRNLNCCRYLWFARRAEVSEQDERSMRSLAEVDRHLRTIIWRIESNEENDRSLNFSQLTNYFVISLEFPI